MWDGRKTVFSRNTTAADTAEAFGVVEFRLPLPEGVRAGQAARMTVDGRIPVVAARDGDALRFRFSPRDAKVWPYVIQSDVAGLNGVSGQFTAAMPATDKTSRTSRTHSQWWTDDPDPAAVEGVHAGAKHVSRWREAFLRDFGARLDRAAHPASK